MNYPSPEFISDRRVDGLRAAMRGILVVCFAVAVGRAAYPYAAAGERRVGENAPYQAVEAAWIDEGIATAGDTGEWSGEVLYERETGRATLDGEYVFTPNTPSTGNYVTLKVIGDVATIVEHYKRVASEAKHRKGDEPEPEPTPEPEPETTTIS